MPGGETKIQFYLFIKGSTPTIVSHSFVQFIYICTWHSFIACQYTNMNIQRKNLSSYNDVFEKKTIQIKFVSFLIKIGIIPMHLSREGKFIFKVFSWKLIVYLFLNVGCICLCKYAQIFVSGQSISEIIGRRTSIDIVSTLIREGLENKKRIMIRYFMFSPPIP